MSLASALASSLRGNRAPPPSAAAASLAAVPATPGGAFPLLAVGFRGVRQARGGKASQKGRQRASPRNGETEFSHQIVEMPWVHADPSTEKRRDGDAPGGHLTAGR
jgi:hypothetical protein